MTTQAETALNSRTKEANNFDTDLATFTPRQQETVDVLDSGKIKYLLYGGALGGGKSYFLRWYSIRRLITIYSIFGIKQAVGMLACENYPALKDRQLSKFGREMPSWLGKLHNDHREYGRCFILNDKWGGGILCFRNLDDPSKYSSAEFAFIFVDELTKNDYDVFTFLRTRLRWPGLPDIEVQFIGATNPGGPGHGWVKNLWLDRNFPPEWVKPVDHRDQFFYMPSKATDNPHLDSSYYATLATLPKNLRAAFRDGNWDIFVGQAFPEFSLRHHVCVPRPIPPEASIYMTFDWGFGAPFALNWFYVDGEGRLFMFAEWYGWNGNPNQGLRLNDSEIAEGIIQREKKLGLANRFIDRLSGPDCWNKKPDYRGGGQGPSTAEVFQEYGVNMRPGDPSRLLKIRQFRERLKVIRPDAEPIALKLGLEPKPFDTSLGYQWESSDGVTFTANEVLDKAKAEGVEMPASQEPMLMVYDSCEQFIRTIPVLVMHDLHVEDLDTTGEDHIYDSVALACMARPMEIDNRYMSLPTEPQRDWLIIHGADPDVLGDAINLE